MSARDDGLRPLAVCRALLDALDATEGRRRRRKRNTGADAIGIGMKRELLEAALRDDPDPGAFEGWLLERCFERPGEGAWRAMALEIFGEWRMAEAAPSFRAWLDAGAPSDDKPRRSAPPDDGPGRSVPPDDRPGRRAPPALIALLALALPVAGCHGGIEADVEDVPEIEVREASTEAAQRAGLLRDVLPPLLEGDGPAATVYDAPLDLARPAAAPDWPPATGTHGDEARGAAPPGPAPGTAPDTAGGGSGGSGGSDRPPALSRRT